MSLPKIYIACLASYNSGFLHGQWVDLDGTEDIAERIAKILFVSPIADAEEWAVHDSEYCGDLSEYPGLDRLESIVEAYQQCQSQHIDWEAFIGFCVHQGEDPEFDQISSFQDAYAGQHSSLEDWCESFLEESGQLESIPKNLRFYFNFEAYARDLEMSDVFTVEHNHDVLVFWRH